MNKPNSSSSSYPPSLLTIIFIFSILTYIFLNNFQVLSAQFTNLISSLFIFVSTGLIVLHRPIWGIALIVFFLPLQSVWPQFTENVFEGIPLVTSFLVIVGGITLVSTLVHIIENKMKLTHIPIALTLAFLFVLWILLNDYLMVTNRDLIDRAWSWTYLQLFFLMSLCFIVVRSTNSVYIIGYSILAGTLLSVIGGVYYGGFTYTQEATFGMRLSGLHGNPNGFAILCVISLISVNFCIPRALSGVNRIFLYSSIPILLFGLVFSISRTGLISAIFIALALIALKFRIKLGSLVMRSLPITFFVIGFIITILLIPSSYRNLWFGSIYTEVTEGIGTTSVRLELWRISLQGFQDNPLIGIGIGNFKGYAAQEWNLSRLYKYRVVHNTYLSILSETGLIGFSLFISFNVFIIYKLLAISRRDQIGIDHRNTIYLVMLTLICWAIYGVFGNGQYGKVLWLFNGVGLALIYNIPSTIKTGSNNEYKTNPYRLNSN